MSQGALFKSLFDLYKRHLSALSSEAWSPAYLFAFRALLIFMLIGESELIRQVLTIGSYIDVTPPSLDSLTVWFGDTCFGVDLSEARPRISGSKMYAWMFNATYLTLSLMIAGVWSLIDRRPRAHPILRDGLWTLLRMIIAYHMFAYGFAKVFGLQFPAPSSAVLMSEVGSLPPAELMKVFMGTSQPYSAIAGWAEVIGGVLLCFRRSTLVGALISFGLMVNILAMNVFYNFGMQRLALELTLITLLVMTPHMRNLFSLIVLNRASEPVDLYGPWINLKWRRAGTVIMGLWCIAALWSKGSEFYEFSYTHGALGPRGALDGTWSVDSMSRDGETLPSMLGSKTRWRSINFDHRPKWTEATIGMLDSSQARYRFVVQGDKILLKEMSFEEDLSGVKQVGELTYKRAPDQVMSIQGEVEGAKIEATLRYMPQTSFKLLNGHVGLIRP